MTTSKGDFHFYCNSKDSLLMSVNIGPCNEDVQKLALCAVVEICQVLALRNLSPEGYNALLVMQLVLNV